MAQICLQIANWHGQILIKPFALKNICGMVCFAKMAWADTNGMAFSYVAAVRRGDVKPSRKILKAMGLKRKFIPDNKAEMKFEDITN